MEQNQTPRALSHDEQHAAEAAFAGRPFNPKWSARARTVYDGIAKVLPAAPQTVAETPAEPQQPLTDNANEAEKKPSVEEKAEAAAAPTIQARLPIQQAIEAGALIDVTPIAKQLGLSFSVTVTKPLWEMGIAPTETVSQEEQSSRLRDLLMAFRLRLAAQPTIAPLIDFPALLAFPPNQVPQPVPLFALIQPDEQNRAVVTLLLPNEVAATIIPMN